MQKSNVNRDQKRATIFLILSPRTKQRDLLPTVVTLWGKGNLMPSPSVFHMVYQSR